MSDFNIFGTLKQKRRGENVWEQRHRFRIRLQPRFHKCIYNLPDLITEVVSLQSHRPFLASFKLSIIREHQLNSLLVSHIGSPESFGF